MERKPSKNDLNSLGDSIATVSGVSIDVPLSERMKHGSDKGGSESVPENNKAKHLHVPGPSRITSNNPPVREDGQQQRARQAFKTESVESKPSSVDSVEDEDDTLKLLQPVSKDQKQTDLVMYLCLFEVDLTSGQLLKFKELLHMFVCQSRMLLMQLLRFLVVRSLGFRFAKAIW